MSAFSFSGSEGRVGRKETFFLVVRLEEEDEVEEIEDVRLGQGYVSKSGDVATEEVEYMDEEEEAWEKIESTEERMLDEIE